MTIPVLTVLMPCKPPLSIFMKEAVRSVLNQTCRDWRLLILHEGDDLAAVQTVLDAAEATIDERISILINQTGSLTGAYNLGMRETISPYVCALNNDDRLINRAVEILGWNFE